MNTNGWFLPTFMTVVKRFVVLGKERFGFVVVVVFRARRLAIGQIAAYSSWSPFSEVLGIVFRFIDVARGCWGFC